MKEDAGVSLRDALLWEKNKVASAGEFVIALQLWQEIDRREAITQFCNLVVCGLRVYDKEHLDEPEVPTHLAVATISSQDIVPPLQEINGEKIPEFSNLTVIRDQAFKIFAKLGVKHPYPWPYPLQMWLNPDLEETEETEEISTSDIIPHGNKKRFSVIRENILSACLAVLATYPSECRNSAGNITATALRECLDRNATKFWPKTGSPPQEAETIEKLINRSLNRIK